MTFHFVGQQKDTERQTDKQTDKGFIRTQKTEAKKRHSSNLQNFLWQMLMTKMEPTTHICRFYKNGKCKYGAECRFDHPFICKKFKMFGPKKSKFPSILQPSHCKASPRNPCLTHMCYTQSYIKKVLFSWAQCKKSKALLLTLLSNIPKN